MCANVILSLAHTTHSRQHNLWGIGMQFSEQRLSQKECVMVYYYDLAMIVMTETRETPECGNATVCVLNKYVLRGI